MFHEGRLEQMFFFARKKSFGFFMFSGDYKVRCYLTNDYVEALYKHELY